MTATGRSTLVYTQLAVGQPTSGIRLVYVWYIWYIWYTFMMMMDDGSLSSVVDMLASCLLVYTYTSTRCPLQGDFHFHASGV